MNKKLLIILGGVILLISILVIISSTIINYNFFKSATIILYKNGQEYNIKDESIAREVWRMGAWSGDRLDIDWRTNETIKYDEDDAVLSELSPYVRGWESQNISMIQISFPKERWMLFYTKVLLRKIDRIILLPYDYNYGMVILIGNAKYEFARDDHYFLMHDARESKKINELISKY